MKTIIFVFLLLAFLVNLTCYGGNVPSKPYLTISEDIIVDAGNQCITIKWSYPPKVTEFNLYWTDDGTIPDKHSNKIENVFSPYLHEGLTNGVEYRYIVAAVRENYEGRPSTFVIAIPQLPLPEPPFNLIANSGLLTTTITWEDDVEASANNTYTIYWTNDGSEPTPTSSVVNVISDVSSPYIHESLTPYLLYRYVATATNESGESNVSNSANAVPREPLDLQDTRWENYIDVLKEAYYYAFTDTEMVQIYYSPLEDGVTNSKIEVNVFNFANDIDNFTFVGSVIQSYSKTGTQLAFDTGVVNSTLPNGTSSITNKYEWNRPYLIIDNPSIVLTKSTVTNLEDVLTTENGGTWTMDSTSVSVVFTPSTFTLNQSSPSGSIGGSVVYSQIGFVVTVSSVSGSVNNVFGQNINSGDVLTFRAGTFYFDTTPTLILCLYQHNGTTENNATGTWFFN